MMPTQPIYVLDMRRLDLRSTAFHEAGHAVSAVLNGISFSRVWILQRRDSDPPPQNTPLGQLTRTTTVNKPDVAGKLTDAKVEAVQALAGPIAECLVYPGMTPDWQLNQDDLLTARSFIRFAIIPFTLADSGANFAEADIKRTETEVNRLLNECYQGALDLVNDHQGAISKVAQALLLRWALTVDEVRDVCLSCSPKTGPGAMRV
jgi:hypothetical protein